MAIDNGEFHQLNSTRDCYISFSISTDVEDSEMIIKQPIQFIRNSSFVSSKKILQWSLSIFDQYSLTVIGLFILFLLTTLTLITICITFCLHTILFTGRKKLQKKQTYHCTNKYQFYDAVHRKASLNHEDSGCSSTKLDDHDDGLSEERERLVNSTSDQTSCESSDSMNRQIRTINQV